MRKLIMLLLTILFLTTAFSSCYMSRKSTTCPSHDPNYFRRGKWFSFRKWAAYNHPL